MYTGFVETMGTVCGMKNLSGGCELLIEPLKEDFSSYRGASISIDGVCLTVDKIIGRKLNFTAVYETVRKTTVSFLKIGQKVNMERCLRVGDRLDGHFVQGHVDCIGNIIRDSKVGLSLYRTIELPDDVMPFIAYKGSVTVDGISLTVAERDSNTCTVSLIPVTLQDTTMGIKKTGDAVNIECDVLARYIANFIECRKTPCADKTLHAQNTTKEKSLMQSLLEAEGF